MSPAYPGPTTELSEIVGRDAFLDALTGQTMRVQILQHGPTTLDEALRWACRIEASQKVADQTVWIRMTKITDVIARSMYDQL